MGELLRESSPINQVTVERPSFPYMTGAVGFVESDATDSESESDFPQTPIPDIREVEDEVEEIDEFFDISETGTPHVRTKVLDFRSCSSLFLYLDNQIHIHTSYVLLVVVVFIPGVTDYSNCRHA
jgi:hypothetical protein